MPECQEVADEHLDCQQDEEAHSPRFPDEVERKALCLFSPAGPPKDSWSTRSISTRRPIIKPCSRYTSSSIHRLWRGHEGEGVCEIFLDEGCTQLPIEGNNVGVVPFTMIRPWSMPQTFIKTYTNIPPWKERIGTSIRHSLFPSLLSGIDTDAESIPSSEDCLSCTIITVPSCTPKGLEFLPFQTHGPRNALLLAFLESPREG